MGLITQTYSFVAGAYPTAAQWNSNWTTMLNLVNGNIDTANVDNTSIGALATANTWTAAQTYTAAVTVGIDGTGHDVTLYSASAGAFSLWDQSADKLIIQGSKLLSTPLAQMPSWWVRVYGQK